jgi:hypothetical protein
MMVPPHGRARRGRGAGLTFRTWLSHTWADIVAHPDPDERKRHRGAGTRIDYAQGVKAADPRRVAVYFAKHGSFAAKEYQHNVPPLWQTPGQGPGRFWGYWNLRRPVRAVELPFAGAVVAARTLRRWARAQGVTHQRAVPRHPGGNLRPFGEVLGLAGAQELAAQEPATMRHARRRARRMLGRYGAGWVATVDGARLAEQLGRAIGLPPAGEPSPAVNIFGRPIRGDPITEPRPPPGMCRACGEPRRRHSCQDQERSRRARAFHRYLGALMRELGHA